MCMGIYIPLKLYLSIFNYKDFKFFNTLDVCDFKFGPKTLP